MMRALVRSYRAHSASSRLSALGWGRSASRDILLPVRGKHTHSRLHHRKDTPNHHGNPSLLETGLVYFLYRPAVEEVQPQEVRSQLISRLYILLSPKGGDPKDPNNWAKMNHHHHHLHRDTSPTGSAPGPPHKRLIVIPRKKLPSVDQHERYLGVVAKVGNLHDVRRVLERGDDLASSPSWVARTIEQPLDQARPVPPVQVAGEGVYGIVEHKQHTHLAFVLELPHEPGQAQRCFNIPKEGSYHLVVRNPYLAPPRDDDGDGAGADHDRLVERDVRAYLAGLAPLPDAPMQLPVVPSPSALPTFVPANPASLLDQEGAEVIVAGSAGSLDEELGRVGQMLRQVEAMDERHFMRPDKPFHELHLHRPPHPATQGHDHTREKQG